MFTGRQVCLMGNHYTFLSASASSFSWVNSKVRGFLFLKPWRFVFFFFFFWNFTFLSLWFWLINPLVLTKHGSTVSVRLLGEGLTGNLEKTFRESCYRCLKCRHLGSCCMWLLLLLMPGSISCLDYSPLLPSALHSRIHGSKASAVRKITSLSY